MDAGLRQTVRRQIIPDLTADGRLIFVTVAVRTFAFGLLSVMLGLYLAGLGLPTPAIGAVFTAALAGSALTTLGWTSVADTFGRRRVLCLAALVMAASGAVFALTGSLPLLVVAALFGTISPSGKDAGPFLSIEQAILPQTTANEERTAVFAAYNLVASAASALGALAVGLPGLFGFPALIGFRLLFGAYVVVAFGLLLLFARLSPAAESDAKGRKKRRAGLHRSRGIVTRLAALFAVDAFAGALVVQGLIAYWFHVRFGANLGTLGAIFFGANLLSALSFLAAAPLARRIGLLNTMVFTHLPSNVLLALVPLMPSLPLAVGMLLARNLLSQLDVPTRQSYTMAVVDPDERSAAAGFTSVARNAAASMAPVFSGVILAAPALGLPFLISGGLKIAYDLSLWRLFRHLRPPEEVA